MKYQTLAPTVLALFTCAAFSAPRPASPPPDPPPTEVKIISVPAAQPTAVKIISTPAPKTETIGEREARLSHEANEQGLTDYTRILANATMGLVLVAVFQALLFLWQLIYMRQGLTDASISANAARDGVIVAKQSMIAENRAYVHYNACTWFSHANHADGRIFWRIRPMWTNRGNTPTRNLNVVVNHALLEAPIDENFEFIAIRQKIPALIAAHGVIGSETFDVFGDDMEAVQLSKKHLYIWGIAWYRDVFPESPEHITKFCVVATNLTGDPKLGWHKDNNPFDIQFINYKSHNCADADCDNYADARIF